MEKGEAELLAQKTFYITLVTCSLYILSVIIYVL